MQRAKKCVAIAMCVCLLTVSLLAVIFIAEHADHDCHGDRCEVCLQIAHADHTLKQLRAALALAAAVAAAVACLDRYLPYIGRVSHSFETPVSLKVQMNN